MILLCDVCTQAAPAHATCPESLHESGTAGGVEPVTT